MLFREHKLQIIIHHHMFASEAGKILRNDAVDLSGFHIVHHALKVRALEIGSAPSVVHINAQSDTIKAGTIWARIPRKRLLPCFF